MLGLLNFDRLFPQIAREETRFMQVSDGESIPDDTYALREFYCVDPDCDCRRVILHVNSSRTGKTVASISFGFDRQSEEAGPFLDPMNPQSRHADELLDVVRDTVLADKSYVARLERHYQMTKAAASDPKHPSHDRIPLEDSPAGTLVRDEPKVGRNDKCPCGSGKKYKKCCLEKDEAQTNQIAASDAVVSEKPWSRDDYHYEADEDDDEDFEDGDDDEEPCPHCGERHDIDDDGDDHLERYADLALAEQRDELRADQVRPSAVGNLSVDEILAKLSSLGIAVSRENFLERSQHTTSAWHLSDEWVNELGVPVAARERDFLGLAACELWKRFSADRPSQEMLYDSIEQGYALSEENREKAFPLWSEAWRVLRGRLTAQMKTFELASPVFQVSSLRGWLFDFSDDLYEESLKQPGLAANAVEIFRQLLAAFPAETEDHRLALRSELGELLFVAGRATDGATLLLELIREFPRRAMGYVHLAQAFERQGELPRAMEILEQAQKADVDDVEEFDVELKERIGELREKLRSQSGLSMKGKSA